MQPSCHPVLIFRPKCRRLMAVAFGIAGIPARIKCSDMQCSDCLHFNPVSRFSIMSNNLSQGGRHSPKKHLTDLFRQPACIAPNAPDLAHINMNPQTLHQSADPPQLARSDQTPEAAELQQAHLPVCSSTSALHAEAQHSPKCSTELQGGVCTLRWNGISMHQGIFPAAVALEWLLACYVQ